jgi:iron complex transport system ATP-binding protein
VLNVLDSDFETAGELNIKTISEAPFSPITPEASAQNLEAMKAADFVVVSDVPIGWGNLQNLEAVMSIAGIKPVILVESMEKRDFTDGKATEMLDRLKSQGAIRAGSADEALAKLETL